MIHLTPHVYLYPYEELRDRPTLGYIVSSKGALAVDAGHSQQHVQDFYRELRKENLKLPELTILTHWHWDHTFGMHAVHGLTAAEKQTNNHLKEVVDNPDLLKTIEKDEHVQIEYQNQELHVVLPNIVFEDHLELDLEDVHISAFHIPSPHTDDCIGILVKEDGVLFVGDAPSGGYPSYEVTDLLRQKALAETVDHLDCQLIVGGHWPVESKEVFLRERCAYNESESR